MKRVAVYARTQAKGETDTLDMQKSRLVSYVKNFPDWELIDVYAERVSGIDMHYMPELNKLLLRCDQEQDIDIIVMTSVTRMGRVLWQVYACLCWLIDRKVEVVFLNDSSVYESLSQLFNIEIPRVMKILVKGRKE